MTYFYGFYILTLGSKDKKILNPIWYKVSISVSNWWRLGLPVIKAKKKTLIQPWSASGNHQTINRMIKSRYDARLGMRRPGKAKMKAIIRSRSDIETWLSCFMPPYPAWLGREDAMPFFRPTKARKISN